MFFTPLFLSNLKTKKIARRIEYLRTTSSTNDKIHSMFEKNILKSGDVLIAEEQTGGKGQRGNKWFSSSGKSLTFSFILKDNNDLLIKKISLISGIAIVQAINQIAKINCQLKWPNDIFFKSKKLGGVLIEKKKEHFIIGIGLNVNDSNFDESIKNKTCSIYSIINRPIQRELLLAFIFNNFEKLLNEDMIKITKKWELFCNHMNTFVKFHYSKNILEGKFIGLNKNGEAKIEVNGRECLFQSGIIEL